MLGTMLSQFAACPAMGTFLHSLSSLLYGPSTAVSLCLPGLLVMMTLIPLSICVNCLGKLLNIRLTVCLNLLLSTRTCLLYVKRSGIKHALRCRNSRSVGLVAVADSDAGDGEAGSAD